MGKRLRVSHQGCRCAFSTKFYHRKSLRWKISELLRLRDVRLAAFRQQHLMAKRDVYYGDQLLKKHCAHQLPRAIDGTVDSTQYFYPAMVALRMGESVRAITKGFPEFWCPRKNGAPKPRNTLGPLPYVQWPKNFLVRWLFSSDDVAGYWRYIGTRGLDGKRLTIIDLWAFGVCPAVWNWSPTALWIQHHTEGSQIAGHALESSNWLGKALR